MDELTRPKRTPSAARGETKGRVERGLGTSILNLLAYTQLKERFPTGHIDFPAH